MTDREQIIGDTYRKLIDTFIEEKNEHEALKAQVDGLVKALEDISSIGNVCLIKRLARKALQQFSGKGV